MCGRYSLTKAEMRMATRFSQQEKLNLVDRPRYNVAPTQAAPVILNHEDSAQVRTMRWGLLPRWSKTLLVNAQSETAAHKPSFKESFASRRCLIPADGFYEWKTQGRLKRPMHFVLKSAQVFCFAGIWEPAPEGDRFLLFTTTPNSLVAECHRRMPTILHPVDYDLWLDPASSIVDLQAILRPYEADRMRGTFVSDRVNDVRNDSAVCLEPAQPVSTNLELFPG
jgi:putative SOS response-associated peptidase YedK